MIGAILGLAALALFVFALIDAIKRQMDTTKKIIWILVILLVPIIGPIVYLVVGRK